MKKLIIFIAIVSLLQSCQSNSAASFPSIDGGQFIRTSYILEVPVDVNGDGIFSNDVLEEFDCGADAMIFTPGEVVANPTFYDIGLSVRTDSNGNKFQNVSCFIADGLFPRYEQIDNELYLLYGDEIELIGEISPDGNRISFAIPREKLYGLTLSGDDILNPDGSTTDYDGDAILIYTRQ